MSQDFLVGSVFNIAQYSMLAHMVAQCTGMIAEEIVWVGSNVHLYKNQLGADLLDLQLSREPFDNTTEIALTEGITDIDQFTFKDVTPINYLSHPGIKYPIAV